MPDQYGMTYEPGATSRSYATTDDGMPTRPYADPGQLGGNAPRTAEMFKGAMGDRGNIASVRNQDPGLSLNNMQFNAQVPSGVRPSSVLQPLMKNQLGLGCQRGTQRDAFPQGSTSAPSMARRKARSNPAPCCVSRPGRTPSSRRSP